jgi:hypothetical protein
VDGYGNKREHVDGRQACMYPRVPRPCVLLSAAGGGRGGGGVVGSRGKEGDQMEAHKRGSRDSGRDLGFHADNFAVVKVVVSLVSQG